MVTQGGRAGAGRDGTERNWTGPTGSLSLSDTFPAFASWIQRVAWAGQNGMQWDRHEQRQQRDRRVQQQQRGKDRGGEQRVLMLLFFVIVSLLTFIFSSFHSFSFPIVSFPTSTTTGGARKESAGRTGRDMRGGDSNVGRHRGCRPGQGHLHLIRGFVYHLLPPQAPK